MLAACGGVATTAGDPAAGSTTGEVGVDPSETTAGEPSRATDRAASTGDASGSTASDESTGAPPDDPPPRPRPAFVDVTVEAGLDLDPGALVGPPACALDDVNDPTQSGDFCFPEYFLGAAAAADYDLDGDVDLYLTRRDGPDRLLANDGAGHFTDVTAASGIDVPEPAAAAAWLDADDDGDLDLMVTVLGAPRHHLWVNAGDGTFADEAIARGVAMDGTGPLVGMGIGVGDYDLDGYLDLFVAEWRPDKQLGAGPAHNRLLHNLGAGGPGYYEDVTDEMGIALAWLAPIVDAKAGEYGFAPAFVDLDDDGWPELSLTADFGTSRLYFNEQGQAFSDLTWESGVGTERNGMGSTFGDFDGDGDQDWFVAAIWTDEFPELGHRLYRNDGARQFSDVTDEFGLRDAGWGWGATWFDRDHDGDLDLAMAAGWPYLGYDADPLRLWDNEGPGPWTDRAVELGVEYPAAGRGLVSLDYDGDGDLDLLVAGAGQAPALFRNDAADGDWLVVEAVGTATNRFGVGAVVRVQVQADGPVQVRALAADSQLFGQAPVRAHFGLGGGDGPIARVTVTWPVTGQVDEYLDVTRNGRLVVTE